MQTIEVFAEAQFADPNSHFVMPRQLGPMVESNVAKVYVS
jgi:hypothetical protein